MYDCIKDLKGWMIRDHLKLNGDKTEFLLIGNKQQLERVNVSSITAGDALIQKLNLKLGILGHGLTLILTSLSI